MIADSALPPLAWSGPLEGPAAPPTPEASGVGIGVLSDLFLRTAFSVPDFTTGWMADQTRLPFLLTSGLLDTLRDQGMLDVLGEAGSLGYRFSISDRGRERARRALEVSGHIGPAPVSLNAYTAVMAWQTAHFAPAAAATVTATLAPLVLAEGVADTVGMAVTSGRSLFLYGPPGNGKTHLARLLHAALPGDIWLPHCVSVEGQVIRVFDPRWHQPTETQTPSGILDARWVRVRRPFLSVGGEATAGTFELGWSPSLRVYEAPMHFKANGGVFLIDDFGRQRVRPDDLLNRWIMPLEYGIDHLTLQTGQTIRVPFVPLLLLATNLDPNRVMDPAFLRRLGYRVHLGSPGEAEYAAIAERYAHAKGLPLAPALLSGLLERYRTTGRPLRACEPRDLIERAIDYCRFVNREPELTEATLERAWVGYFGQPGS